MKTLVLTIITLTFLYSCSSTKNIRDSSEAIYSEDEVAAPSFYQEKFLRGIDFFARGNEPNWVLEIDFEKSMRFSEMGGIELTTPPSEGSIARDADITFYRSVAENQELSVTISGGQCEDNMSGEKFDYQVTTEVKNSLDKTTANFSGCGKFLYDYRLNDIWVMEEITNVDLKTSTLMKGLPTFEFDLREMRFGGHAGCNNLFGKIELMGNKISFGNVGATMMACPDMKVERAVIDAINLKRFTYRIENLRLTLENESVKIVFKKVD